jgi:hypothetical protein
MKMCSFLLSSIALAAALSTSCKKRDFSDSEANTSSALRASVNLLNGRFLGIPETKAAEAAGIKSKHVGLLLEPLPDRSGSLAIVIHRTNIFQDALVENLKRGLNRVVDRLSLYKVKPVAGSSDSFEFIPLEVRDGVLTERILQTDQKVSVLHIGPRKKITGLAALMPQSKSEFSAVLTAAPGVGEPVDIVFETFLKDAKTPSSTWDKDYISDAWENEYTFAKGCASRTTLQNQVQKMEVMTPETMKGQYALSTLSFKNSRSSQLTPVFGLYYARPVMKGAQNSLDERLAIFIDVVNRKKIGFATRELFLVDPKGTNTIYSKDNESGFVMYFQRNQKDDCGQR